MRKHFCLLTLVWVAIGETLAAGLLTVLGVEGAASYLPFRALNAATGTGPKASATAFDTKIIVSASNADMRTVDELLSSLVAKSPARPTTNPAGK